MKKRIVTIFLCAIIMSMVFCPTAFASDTKAVVSASAIECGFDTLSYSGDTYLSLADVDMNSNDDEIQNLIVGYLATEKAYVRSPEKYMKATGFVDEKAMSSKTITYRESESDYRRELNQLMGWTIYKDNLSFSDFRVEVKDNIAYASIVEDYRYYIDDDFGGESFRRREYTFELVDNTKGWKIVNVTTNDPWEIEETFSYDAIDVDGIIAQMAYEMRSSSAETQKIVLADELGRKTEAVRTSLNRWEYSKEAAVNYAEEHYDDTSNSVFGFTSGSDCQNFASQCVWAGLGGSGSSTSARPAVSVSLAGNSAPNVWQRSVSTECYSSNTYWLNWTWDNTRGFANMISVSTPTLEGPFGNTQYSGYFGYTDVGNVLEVDWEGEPARDTLNHAMFVTEVSGNAGSRTTSQVKIAAHTSPTNSAYETLSAYTTEPATSFARVIIVSGYYATTQP